MAKLSIFGAIPRFAKDTVGTYLVRELWKHPRLHWLLRFAGWRRLSVAECSSEHDGYIQIAKDETWMSVGLRDWKDPSPQFVERFKKNLGCWQIHQASVNYNSKFQSVIWGNELLIHPRFESPPYHLYAEQSGISASGIRLQNEDSVLIAPARSRTSIPVGVYCGFRAPHNWGHWLLNFMPGVSEAADYFGASHAPPLLVSPDYLMSPSRAELFEHIWGDRGVYILEKGSEISVEQLFWFEQPVADSPRTAIAAQLKHKAVMVNSLLKFRSKVLQLIENDRDEFQTFEKVFLARELGRRDYNQREIHEVASELGYEVIYPNRLTLRHQLCLMAGAKRIAGPIGSAFANILFSGPDTKALLFARPDEDIDNGWWSPFASVAGVDLAAVYRSGDSQNPWALDPRDVRVVLQEFSSGI